MSAHTRYNLVYVYDGETFVEELFFQEAVNEAAECLRRGCWPVTIKPIEKVDTTEHIG